MIIRMSICPLLVFYILSVRLDLMKLHFRLIELHVIFLFVNVVSQKSVEGGGGWWRKWLDE